MKAIQITETGGPDVLRYVEIEKPSIGHNQVLIKIKASGVNFADVLVRSGALPTIPLPVIPGEEYSGIIEAVADDVTDFKPGQRVVVLLGHGSDSGHVSGGYAEYAVAQPNTIIPIPDAISFEIAAATFANYLTAYFLLHHTVKVEAGQNVLLYAAAGGGGTAMIQLAKLAGVNIIGLTSSEKRADYARSQGATHVINYNKQDIHKTVMKITNDKGVDIIFNSAGGVTLARDFDLLAPFGQIIWYGTAAGLPEANLMQLLSDTFHKHNGIKTFLLHGILQYKPVLWRQVTKTIIDYLLEGKISPHMHSYFDLSQAVHAHRQMETSQVYGKVVLKP